LHGDGQGVNVQAAAVAVRKSGWLKSSLQQRCSWLDKLGAKALSAGAKAQLADRALPGPTGESNELRLHPRGVVAAIADRVDDAILAQWMGALAGGNALVVALCPAKRARPCEWPWRNG
jgi:RHH-type transcriptional regulator, proline utilization regulon repressor / proline dehydrogenase / delta 1-pyrroline-5-carboxylate dehydrogenase